MSDHGGLSTPRDPPYLAPVRTPHLEGKREANSVPGYPSITELHLATGLRGQRHTETAGVLQARSDNPLIQWEALEDPRAREGAEKPSSRVFLDGIRGPAGVGLREQGLTPGNHEGISEESRRRPGSGPASPPETTCDPVTSRRERPPATHAGKCDGSEYIGGAELTMYNIVYCGKPLLRFAVPSERVLVCLFAFKTEFSLGESRAVDL